MQSKQSGVRQCGREWYKLHMKMEGKPWNHDCVTLDKCRKQCRKSLSSTCKCALPYHPDVHAMTIHGSDIELRIVSWREKSSRELRREEAIFEGRNKAIHVNQEYGIMFNAKLSMKVREGALVYPWCLRHRCLHRTLHVRGSIRHCQPRPQLRARISATLRTGK